MELFSREEFEKYIIGNFKLLIKGVRNLESDRVPGKCNSCARDVFFKINSYYETSKFGFEIGMPDFETIYFECPNCKRRNFVQCVVLKEEVNSVRPMIEYLYKHYELYRLPERSIEYETMDIPNEYATLISAVNEALFCMNYDKYISSAIMFRRALQLIAKDVLGAKDGSLFSQLEWLKENPNLLNVDLTEIFHDNSKLIKDVGNQAAHPDKDLTLQDFSKEDVNRLYDLFIIIVNEVFIKPKKIKELQDELKAKRKIT